MKAWGGHWPKSIDCMLFLTLVFFASAAEANSVALLGRLVF